MWPSNNSRFFHLTWLGRSDGHGSFAVLVCKYN
jgi:hypothetical protein